MIVVFEEATVKDRYPSGEIGVQSFDEDKEEWLGVRSQLIALLYGWGL